ncbi:hypothetical protein D9M70_506020 [compost metagenome]
MLGEPEMAGVEGLDLGADAKCRHLARHFPQHRWRVGHDIIAEREVHGAAVERADFRQALGHMGDTLGGAGHVGALLVDGQGAFDIAEHQVAAHAGRQVQHDIDIGGADAVGHFPVEIEPAGGRAGFRIANVAVDHGGPGLGCLDRRFGDLFRRDRNMAGLRNGVSRAGDGTGDEYLAVHAERHCCLPFIEAITSQERRRCFS